MALTLTAMRGYPASGKSTKARRLSAESGAVIVCRDDLRMMLHGTFFSGKSELEDEVTVAERAQVHAFLKAGKSVIVDATHLHTPFLRKWAKMSAQYGAAFRVVDVLESPDECVERDLERARLGGRYVGEEVIRRLAKRFPCRNWPNITAPPTFNPEPVEWIAGLPEAIIVDIDGTLAHMTGRSPYDYTQVHTDTVDEHIRWLVGRIDLHNPAHMPVKILIVSGRDDECRSDTAIWLYDNGIRFDELHMRPTGAVDNHGNKLPDYLVKSALFDEHIRGKYNVRLVLDDRDQVVALWRSLGLKTLQVQPGDF